VAAPGVLAGAVAVEKSGQVNEGEESINSGIMETAHAANEG
jgi:hypothetical protein